jgi:hypothetical protein
VTGGAVNAVATVYRLGDDLPLYLAITGCEMVEIRGKDDPMAHLNSKIQEARLEALRRYAARRRTPVSWLIKDYVDYLIEGGRPIARLQDEAPTGAELAALAEHGGAFDWLADEPDFYSAGDGEPV